jgi:hypothetical protein
VDGPKEFDAIWLECCGDDPIPQVDWATEGVICYEWRTAQCPDIELVPEPYEHAEDQSVIVFAINLTESCMSDCEDTGETPVTYLWLVPSASITSCYRGLRVQYTD